MKFYDLEWLSSKLDTDNKYKITAEVAAKARQESEEVLLEKTSNPGNERYISNVLLEIEAGRDILSELVNV